ncbi:unnamed protein product [Ilex paraguariensis]|uniref:Diacylglycerol O-acyltransferase 3 n=1 Tax=Ilex paraguariensis TaxID=185542 RepID=A0ABC8RGI9_9AQUA
MEVSGVVLRRLPCFSGAGVDFNDHYSPSKPSFTSLSVDAGARFSGELRSLVHRDSRVSVKSRKFSGFSSSGFCDDGHVQYYSGSTSTIRCSGGKREKAKEKEKVKDTMAKEMKKRLKLLKGLRRDLSTFSEMGFGLDPDHGLVDQVKGKMISEAAELLLGQLERIRAEEKELKRKKKEENAKLKSMRMQTRLECEESSNSSSESSNSECGEVVDMSRLRSGGLPQPIPNALQLEATSTFSSTFTSEGSMTEIKPVTQEAVLTLPSTPTQGVLDVCGLTQMQSVSEEAVLMLPSTLIRGGNLAEERCPEVRGLNDSERECCSGTSTICSNLGSVGSDDGHSLVTGASMKAIEVCMGGKCKKSGAAALLEEFQKVVGVETAVSGCKCMGKCRDGPNVRVCNDGGIQADSVRTPTNPLYIGVGLEDVGLIVANFFGGNENKLDLAAAS